MKEGKVFTIQEPNSCKLKLNIPLELVNEVNKDLDKDHENSGVIYCDGNNNVIGINKTKGDSDSVYTPNNVINFHTHPISAYNNGETVWGWPSGEDIRETIKFALAGNKAHLVFSNEGLYTIQVSPCKIKKIKELLNDRERGVLIFLIEEYFKTTHNFRGVSEVNKFYQNGKLINPYTYVDFINNFDISNLSSGKDVKTMVSMKFGRIKETGHTGIHGEENINHYTRGDSEFSKIPNVGFPVISGTKIINKSVKDYIQKDDLKELRSINAKGEESTFGKKNIIEIIKIINNIAEKFNTKKCAITWNSNPNAWFFVNFFPSENYNQKSYQKGDKLVTPDKKIPVINGVEPFIRIFSSQKDGCSVEKIRNNFKFKIGKMTFKTGGQRSCKNCGFGKTLKTLKTFSKKKELIMDLKKLKSI